MRPPYAGRRILVAGAGVSGAAAADALLDLGARVEVVDDRDGERLAALAGRGATVHIGLPEPPAGTELVVTSPGWRPDHPLLRAAADRGIEVVGEVELAWRLRPAGAPPWIGVTGTNGKTTTVALLEAMLRAAGRRVVAAGNVGRPLVPVVLAGAAYDVLAVELSSFQLHWSPGVRCTAAAVLNLAEDHLDWHGSMAAYVAAKGRIVTPDTLAVYPVADERAAALARRGRRAVGCTVATPAAGQVGVDAGWLVDRAFAAEPVLLARRDAVPLPGEHQLANALAAAALARAAGVPPGAVAAGLAAFRPGRHRGEVVATVAGVDYADDSKATNPHAAAAALAARRRVVWIAGGLLKGLSGAALDGLVAGAADRLAGAVLLGRDRSAIAAAIARHAPDVPVIEVARTDDGAMRDVVAEAARLARPGDTVLLAPAAASMDMFTDYAARGDAFAAAVQALGGR